MGNRIAGVTGRSKIVKVMKVNGETLKLRVPLTACDVTKQHPGHTLLDADAVKHFGIRARPLEPHQDLKPKKTYFLIEIPLIADLDRRDPDRDRDSNRFDGDRRLISGRRVQSGISVSAKDRLECLMLARRSASDLTVGPVGLRGSPGPVRVRMRLPKAEMARVVAESRDEAEVAEKIFGIYMRSNDGDVTELRARSSGAGDKYGKARQKRVSFLPVEEGEIRLAVDKAY